MKIKRPPIPVIIVASLVLIISSYFVISALLKLGNNALSASGTIEAVEINISPELSGKVSEVLVDEGDSLQAEDELFILDDTMLQAQRAVAAANLDVAQAAADTADAALAAVLVQSTSSRTDSWRVSGPTGFTLPSWYFSRNEEIEAAQAELVAALSAVTTSQEQLDDLLSDPASAQFVASETRLNNAKAAVIVAKAVLDHTDSANDGAEIRSVAQDAYDASKNELEDAQDAYDEMTNTDTAEVITTARAELAVAQERNQVAQDHLVTVQSGIASSQLAGAESTIRGAETSANQANLIVKQSEANLAIIDAQIEKLTVRAPSKGVILTRSIEPGEVVAAGELVMTIGQLDDLTITVYVPEDRYGELSIGQSASMTVDSFPDETFEAALVHISDQAEFTPRNVQTVEGRKSTVYANPPSVPSLRVSAAERLVHFASYQRNSSLA